MSSRAEQGALLPVRLSRDLWEQSTSFEEQMDCGKTNGGYRRSSPRSDHLLCRVKWVGCVERRLTETVCKQKAV